MSMAETVKCPRCVTASQSPSEGYIFWEEATDEERSAAGAPDDDNEIQCPLCESYGYLDGDEDIAKARAWEEAQNPVDPAIRGLEWAGIPEDVDAEIPMPKFRFDWVDDNHANVIAVPDPPNEAVRIGILGFDADSWSFTRIDRNDDQVIGADTIDCDPATEARLREMYEETLTTGGGEAVIKAKLAALDTQRDLFRDDSRDVAELGARLVARKWWRIFWSAAD